MKILLIFIGCAAMIVAGGGCVTCMKQCPPQDVVFSIVTPFGAMPVKMKKGHLNPDKERENWITSEEFDRQMNQSQEPEEEEKELNKEGQKHGI